MNLDALKPAPMMDTVRFESEPPGAEAKTSNGQTCRTPCALALPTGAPLTVTFVLNGYQLDTESIDSISGTNGMQELRPNPVQVEMIPAPPPLKPVKKPVAKKKTGAKPVAKPKTATAPAPMTGAPAQQPAPWPATPAPKQ